MRKTTKLWLIVASSLVLIGCMLFGGVMTMLKWDFTKLSTVKYETNEYAINEDYKNLRIVTKTADISFVPSEDGSTSVVCHEQTNKKHTVTVQDGTLTVEVVDTQKWYEYIGIQFGTPKITVYIPQGEYGALMVKSSTGDVDIPTDFTFESIAITESTGNVTSFASASEWIRIQTSTGAIHLENVSAGALDLTVSTGTVTVSGVACEGDVAIKVSTGKTNLTDIACKNVLSSGNTGDISLKNVRAAESFSIERSTGDVRFDGADAAEILVKTDTGDVTGTLLSDKIFFAESDTGRVSVPKTTTGGRCDITTDTGNITISIE